MNEVTYVIKQMEHGFSRYYGFPQIIKLGTNKVTKLLKSVQSAFSFRNIRITSDTNKNGKTLNH